MPVPSTLLFDHSNISTLASYVAESGTLVEVLPDGSDIDAFTVRGDVHCEKCDTIMHMSGEYSIHLPSRSRACFRGILVSGLNAKRTSPIVRFSALTMGHHSSTYGAYTDTQLAMDARAFGISRKESIEMNPQMILILEVSSAAISAALTTSRVHL